MQPFTNTIRTVIAKVWLKPKILKELNGLDLLKIKEKIISWGQFEHFQSEFMLQESHREKILKKGKQSVLQIKIVSIKRAKMSLFVIVSD